MVRLCVNCIYGGGHNIMVWRSLHIHCTAAAHKVYTTSLHAIMSICTMCTCIEPFTESADAAELSLRNVSRKCLQNSRTTGKTIREYKSMYTCFKIMRSASAGSKGWLCCAGSTYCLPYSRVMDIQLHADRSLGCVACNQTVLWGRGVAHRRVQITTVASELSSAVWAALISSLFMHQ